MQLLDLTPALVNEARSIAALVRLTGRKPPPPLSHRKHDDEQRMQRLGIKSRMGGGRGKRASFGFVERVFFWHQAPVVSWLGRFVGL